MIIYLPNDLVQTLENLATGISTVQQIDERTNRLATHLLTQLKQEKSSAPYQLWLRDQKHEQANRKHSAGAAEHDPRAASRTNKRNKAEQVHGKAGRRLDKKKGGKGQSTESPRKPV